MKNTFFKKLVFLIPALFLIASCSDFLDGIQTEDGTDTNAGTDGAVVTFNISSSRTSAGRTALPSVEFENYVYSITASCKALGIVNQILADNLTIDNLSGHKFSMTRAVWIFKVLAYEKANKEKIVFEGNSDSVDLVQTAVAQVNMVLRATTGGSGSVKIPVTYDKSGVKTVTAALYTDPTGTTLAEDADGNTFSEKVFTSESGIMKNDDGTYSLTYTQDNIPSGQTYYARISMYDKNGVCVGTYIEAVYVAEGLESTPVIYAKNDDGTYKKDEKGNYIEETEPEKQTVTMQADLYTATVAAEAGKNVIVEDENGNSYTLTDEDGDGVYDGELPPGDYKVKIGDTPEEAENAEPNEDVTLDVGAKEVVSDSPMLKEVKLSENAVVGATLEAKAFAKIGTDITEKVSLQWFSGEDTDEDGKPDSEWLIIEDSVASTYKLTSSDEGKFFKVVATQEFNGETVTKEAVSSAVEKGSLTTDYIITYGEEVSVTVIKGSEAATVKSEKLTVSNVKDTEGNEIAATATFIDAEGKAVTEKTLESSESLSIKISADGYNASTKTFYITVKAAEPAVALSTDSVNIVDGMVAFESALEGAVYSTDGGENWNPVSTAPFTPPAEEGKILVKTVAVGTEGEDGYIAESETKEITVAETNLGTKLEAIAENGVTLSGTAKVGDTISASVKGEDETNLTDSTNVSYQWYASVSETGEGNAINGATGKAFTLTPSEAGKFIYVEAVQANPKTQVAQTVSSGRTEAVANGALNDSDLSISYTDVVLAGTSPSVEKLAADGKLTGGTNNAEISQSAATGDGGYVLSVPNTALTSSCYVTVLITAAGYESITKEVFVIVQANAPGTDGLLSTEKSNISSGYIKFSSADSTLEYTVDGGTTWLSVSTEELKKPESLKIRKKAVDGTPDANENPVGCIKESAEAGVTVSDDNVGIKVAAKGAQIEVEPFGDIKIEKTESEGTITLTAATGFTDYSWEIDGTALTGTGTTGFAVDGGVLTITTANLEKGTYQITVNGTRSGIFYSTGISVKVE